MSFDFQTLKNRLLIELEKKKKQKEEIDRLLASKLQPIKERVRENLSYEKTLKPLAKQTAQFATEQVRKLGELPTGATERGVIFSTDEPIFKKDEKGKTQVTFKPTPKEEEIKLKEFFQPKSYTGGRVGKGLASDVETAFGGLMLSGQPIAIPTQGATLAQRAVGALKTGGLFGGVDVAQKTLRGEEVKPEEVATSFGLGAVFGFASPRPLSTASKTELGAARKRLTNYGFRLSDYENPSVLRSKFTSTVKNLHPDAGGSQTDFVQFMDDYKTVTSAPTESAINLKANDIVNWAKNLWKEKKPTTGKELVKTKEPLIIDTQPLEIDTSPELIIDTAKPKTKLLKEAERLRTEAQPELEMGQAKATIAKEERSLFSPEIINSINKVKRFMGRGDFTGDIESLRNTSLKDDVNVAVEAVREMRPDITDESEALDAALNFPTLAETRVTTPQEIFKARELEKQAKETRDLVYNAEVTPETKAKMMQKNEKALEYTANKDFDEWQKSIWRTEGARTVRGAASDLERSMKAQTFSAAASDVEQLKDIGNVKKALLDPPRIFESVYGKDTPQFAAVKRTILDPFDKAKGNLTREYVATANELEKDIVKGLGIKKGSDVSAAVQLFGEGKITREELVKRFGELKAQNIIEADQWFRARYDTFLNEVNEVYAKIYPNQPDKLVPRRDNYYRHFRELARGLGGLKNIFDQPANIPAKLSKIPEYLRPKSRFQSFAQKREGERTEIDAVGGYIDYVKSAIYAKHVDPTTAKLRALRNELAEATAGKEGASLNNFLRWLDAYADDLAVKTNPVDRAISEWVPGGRTALNVLTWLNNRAKANVILYNMSASLAQIYNIPQGIANTDVHSVKGLQDTLASIFVENKAMAQSDFIKHRYTEPWGKFDVGMVNDVKKFGIWMTKALDEAGTKFIWNSHYRQAVARGIDDPVRYADAWTRKMVAGRGVGEVPLMQKTKFFQLVAPFQLEVANIWWVMKDWFTAKQFGRLAIFFVASYVLNKAIEKVRGHDVGFDPIDATIEAIQTYQEEEDKKIGVIRAGGRMLGEIGSNIPFGQTLATLYPEYGVKIPGTDENINRKELFGSEDPTRFGTGGLLAKSFQKPLNLILPFAGQQITRSYQGVKDYLKGYTETRGENVRYPIDKDKGSLFRSLTFGTGSLPQAQEYFDTTTPRPMKGKGVEAFKRAVELGEEPSVAFNQVRILNSEYVPNNTKALQKLGLDEKSINRMKAEYVFTELNKAENAKKRAAELKENGTLTSQVFDQLEVIVRADDEGVSKEDRMMFVIEPGYIRAWKIKERLESFTDQKNADKKLMQYVELGLLDEKTKEALKKINGQAKANQGPSFASGTPAFSQPQAKSQSPQFADGSKAVEKQELAKRNIPPFKNIQDKMKFDKQLFS